MLKTCDRACDDEGVPLFQGRSSLARCWLEGGQPAGQLLKPYNLPEGETYHIVHAEMQLQHRWVS